MTFKPGTSGNPGGRPRGEREVLELARESSPRAIGRLIELIEHEDPRTSIAACNAVLDRAFGKPTQRLAGDPEGAPIQLAAQTPSVEALAQLSAGDRATIRQIIGRALTGPKGEGSQ